MTSCAELFVSLAANARRQGAAVFLLLRQTYIKWGEDSRDAIRLALRAVALRDLLYCVTCHSSRTLYALYTWDCAALVRR